MMKNLFPYMYISNLQNLHHHLLRFCSLCVTNTENNYGKVWSVHGLLRGRRGDYEREIWYVL